MSFLAPRSHGPGYPAAATISPFSAYELPKTEYPMFVMTISSFLEFDLLPDHQELLALGDTLFVYDSETMCDRIFFISHQCKLPHRTPCHVPPTHTVDTVVPVTSDISYPFGSAPLTYPSSSSATGTSHAHGDSTGRQLKTLQTVFLRLLSGDIPQIEGDWRYQLFVRDTASDAQFPLLAPTLRRLPRTVRTAQPYTALHTTLCLFRGGGPSHVCSSGGVGSLSPLFLGVFQSVPLSDLFLLFPS